MQNKHDEFIRISDNKKVACLMVHGIVGTPRYFDKIIPLLPSDWSIYNILLDGHGKRVKDFSGTSMKKWKAQVEDIITRLENDHEEIIIIAHSMGTLLTLDASMRHTKIKSMILFAVPLVPFVKPVALTMSLKVVFKIANEDEAEELAAKKQYSIEPDWRLWRYIGFAPRYIELLGLIREVKGKIDNVNIPCSIFMCGKDEMVSVRSRKHLKNNPNFTNHFLKSSSHNWFEENDFEYVKQEIKKILEGYNE